MTDAPYELQDMLAHAYGKHIPEELQALVDEITSDGEVTPAEREQLLEAMHIYAQRTSPRFTGPDA